MGFLTAFIVTAIVVIFGGGLCYLFYIKTRPKKEIWKARVYQLADGIKDVKIGEDGKIIGKFSLRDLVPYTRDILERVEKEPGITVFRLRKLNKPTPAVEAGCSEMWGDSKEVNVLFHEGTCTLLKQGYETNQGYKIYTPLPHHRINNIKSEMAIRKDRLRKEKDILEAITPWIVSAIAILGIIFVAYIMIEGFIKISDNINEVEMAQIEKCNINTGQVVTPLNKDNKDLGAEKEKPPILEEYSGWMNNKFEVQGKSLEHF